MSNVCLVITILLSVIGGLILWFTFGFIGFLLEAKYMKWEKFHRDVQDDFICCLLFGPLCLVLFSVYLLNKKIPNIMKNLFNALWKNFGGTMDSLLYKMNHKESEE